MPKISGVVEVTTEDATAQIDVELQDIERQLRQALDEYALRTWGVESILDAPADRFDINEADERIGGLLREYHTFPMEWVAVFVARNQHTRPKAAEYAERLKGPQHVRRKLEREARRHIGRMRTVWSRVIMPWLVDVSEAARAEAAGATVRALAQDGRLRIPSSWYTHELGRAIAHRDFKRTDTIPFPTAAMKDGHAVVVPDKALQGAWAAWPEEEISRAVAAMDRRLSTFGQRTRDVYKVLLARWLQHKSSAAEGNPWIEVDEIASLLGHAKKDRGTKRAGFTDEVRSEIRRAIENLAHIEVEIPVDSYRQGRRFRQTYRGRFLMLGDRKEQRTLDGGAGPYSAIEFALPALAQQSVEQGVVAYLHLGIKALQYPEHAAYEKGLAAYFAELARINRSNVVRVTVAKALRECGQTEPSLRKARTIFRRFDQALQTLEKDGLIDTWKYLDPEWEYKLREAWERGTKPRGWQEEWLSKVIEVYIPDGIGYATLERATGQRKRNELPAPPPGEFQLQAEDLTNLGERVAAAMGSRELTKQQAAAEIGVSRPTLDAILSGGRVAPRVQKKTALWLRGA